jgi:hypothetical protein
MANTELVGGLEHEFDDFPFIGKNQRKLTNIFQRGSNQQPVKILVWSEYYSMQNMLIVWYLMIANDGS